MVWNAEALTHSPAPPCAELKQQREHGRTMRKTGRYTGTPEELRQALAAVPF